MGFGITVRTEDKINELKAARENGAKIQKIEDRTDGTTRITFC